MLNLRCLYCQTPFTVGRVEMLTALIAMDEKNQTHHDAHCPRCRRANSISRQRMELFFPNWREAAKQMASMPAAPASAAVKTEPLPRSLKNVAVKTATSKKTSAANAKISASKRRRASKPSSAKKIAPTPKAVSSKSKKSAAKPKTVSKPKTKKK
ncbi:hypothetical protein FBQ83_12810 [Chloroflexi bacterium CFX5]|nr:hypothetical protein [Anaerolineales bacterium]MDL1920184.1 hypothetical protein [Chloroflexi bacterium CFX5]NUQ58550.1 hypothetical protein [Anaerolineales bacterium]